MAREIPIELWRRSNDPPAIWDFLKRDLSPSNLSGYAFEIVAAWAADSKYGTRAGRIQHDTEHETLDLILPQARVLWRPTLEENASLPRTGARYELFSIKDGLRRLRCGGTIVMRGFL